MFLILNASVKHLSRYRWRHSTGGETDNRVHANGDNTETHWSERSEHGASEALLRRRPYREYRRRVRHLSSVNLDA